VSVDSYTCVGGRPLADRSSEEDDRQNSPSFRRAVNPGISRKCIETVNYSTFHRTYIAASKTRNFLRRREMADNRAKQEILLRIRSNAPRGSL
jgi:hypothetical protein